MRALILTAAGGRLWSYAPFETARGIIHTVLNNREDAWFDWVLPEPDGREWKYDTAEVERILGHPRLRFHYVPMLHSAIDGVTMATMDLYRKLNVMKTETFYDAILNYWVIFSPVLKKVLKAKFERMNVSVPIFNFPSRVQADNKIRMQFDNYYGEDEVLGEACSYLIDYTVFLMEEEKRLAMGMAKKYLSPAMVKRLDKNSFVAAYGGLDIDALKKQYENRQWPYMRECTDPCVFFGGRWAGVKGFSDIVELMAKLKAKDKNVRCVCTTGQAKTVDEIQRLQRDYPGVEFYHSVNREKFYEMSAQGDIFLCLSTVESFGTSYWEMLYSGQLGIFLKSNFSHEILPSGYPYVVSSKNDLSQMLDSAVRVIRQSSGKRVQSYIESTIHPRLNEYDFRTANLKLWDWLEQKTQEYRKQFTVSHGGLFELTLKALTTLDREVASFDEVCQQMTALSKNKRVFGKKGDMISRPILRQMMLDAGWRDLCNDETPMFVRD